MDFELDELNVAESSKLEGVSVRQTEARRGERVLVVGVRQVDGKMLFNPQKEYVLQNGDAVIVMGRYADIERFRADSSH